MFEDYDDVFGEPSEADAIIQQAQDDITELLKKSVVKIADDARDAKKNLEEVNRQIREAELKLNRLKNEIAAEEKLADKCKMQGAPRRFLERITRDATKGFAPEDEVYYLTSKSKNVPCGLCKGKKKVSALINGDNVEITCPKCRGYGSAYETEPVIEKRKIREVRLKLCFESGRVGYWSTNCITLYDGLVGGDEVDAMETTNLFKTEEEAKEELKKREVLKT